MSRPNVILLVLDAVRPDHLSCYGYHRRTTPNIDDIAAEGVLYENAFSNSNYTAEAHPPIFTGRLPSRCGCYGDDRSLPAETDLLSERLQAAGYRTFATSAGAHIREGRGYDRGFDVFHETHRFRPTLGSARKLLTERTYRDQAAFTLTRGPDDKTLYKFETLREFVDADSDPFFAFLNCKTAHYPYNPPRPFKSEYCPELERPRYEFLERLYETLGSQAQSHPDVDIESCRRNPGVFMTDAFSLSKRELEVIKSWYNGCIRYLDEQIGRLIESLRASGTLNDTCLILTADHGEMFGEKGLMAHGFSLYDTLLRVPMVVRPPGGADRRRLKTPVSLIDLFATILEAAGAPRPNHPHSRSLLPFDGEIRHEHLFAEVGQKNYEALTAVDSEYDPGPELAGPLQSVRDERFKLIVGPEGHTELYDWHEDPKEQEDLSDSRPETVAELSAVLEAETGDMTAEAAGEEQVSDSVKEALEHLGYR